MLERPIIMLEKEPPRRWPFFGIDMQLYPAMFVIINIVLEPRNCSRSALTSIVADMP
jgi:hypothetical protein